MIWQKSEYNNITLKSHRSQTLQIFLLLSNVDPKVLTYNYVLLSFRVSQRVCDVVGLRLVSSGK